MLSLIFYQTIYYTSNLNITLSDLFLFLVNFPILTENVHNKYIILLFLTTWTKLLINGFPYYTVRDYNYQSAYTYYLAIHILYERSRLWSKMIEREYHQHILSTFWKRFLFNMYFNNTQYEKQNYCSGILTFSSCL